MKKFKTISSETASPLSTTQAKTQSKLNKISTAAEQLNQHCIAFDKSLQPLEETDILNRKLPSGVLQSLKEINTAATQMIEALLDYPMKHNQKQKWSQLSSRQYSITSSLSQSFSTTRGLREINELCNTYQQCSQQLTINKLPIETNIRKLNYPHFIRISNRLKAISTHVDRISQQYDSQSTEILSNSTEVSFNSLNPLNLGAFVQKKSDMVLGSEHCQPPASRMRQMTGAVKLLERLWGNFATHLSDWWGQLKGQSLESEEQVALNDAIITKLSNCLAPWIQYPNACTKGNQEILFDNLKQDIENCLQQNKKEISSLSVSIQTAIAQRLISDTVTFNFPWKKWKSLERFINNQLQSQILDTLVTFGSLHESTHLPVEKEEKVPQPIEDTFNTMIQWRRIQNLSSSKLLTLAPFTAENDLGTPSYSHLHIQPAPLLPPPTVHSREIQTTPAVSGGSAGAATASGVLLLGFFAGSALLAWWRKGQAHPSKQNDTKEAIPLQEMKPDSKCFRSIVT